MRTTYLRIAQFASAIVVGVLLSIHMVVAHLNNVLLFFGVGSVDPTAWESVVNRSRQASWAAIYIALLAFGLFHAIEGLRGIIFELRPSPGAARVITGVLIVVGVAFFVLGTYVPLALLNS